MISFRVADPDDDDLVESIYDLRNFHPDDTLARMSRPKGQTKDQIRRLMRLRANSADFYYCIDKSSETSSEVVGFIQAVWDDTISRVVEVGIVIYPSHRNKGHGRAPGFRKDVTPLISTPGGLRT